MVMISKMRTSSDTLGAHAVHDMCAHLNTAKGYVHLQGSRGDAFLPSWHEDHARCGPEGVPSWFLGTPLGYLRPTWRIPARPCPCSQVAKTRADRGTGCYSAGNISRPSRTTGGGITLRRNCANAHFGKPVEDLLKVRTALIS